MPSRGTTLDLQPYSSTAQTLFSIATSLSDDHSIPNWLTFTPKRVLQNGVAAIAGTSSSIHAATAVLFGLGSLGVGLYFYVWENRSLRSALAWLSSHFTGSISIASTHPLNKDVPTYVEKNGLGRKAKFLALVNPNFASNQEKRIEARSQEPLEYVPTCGSCSFWHNGYRLVLTRHEEVSGYYGKDGEIVRTKNGSSDPCRGQTLTLTCWSLGAGVQPVKDFIQHVRESVDSKLNITTIFRASYNIDAQKFIWDSGVNRPARTVDSIALEAGKKKTLLKECTRYFSDEEERFYACRGLPYRRGMLFYGPPGTGKSSFCVALAGHFKLNVYMISMSDEGLNDRGIGNLFDTLPKRCIVLLEDIDSSGIDREPAKVEIPDPNDPTKTKTKEKVKVGVTLSGLLNVLDGPASGVGRLVVMTSNCPDSLDAALLRPGRIDSKILFGYADREVSRSIFTQIFAKAADERSSPGEQRQEGSHSTHLPPEDLSSFGFYQIGCAVHSISYKNMMA